MTVRSRETPATTARPRIGFLQPGHIEGAFRVLIYLALLILVALSVFGTFYGRRGEDAPLAQPLRIIGDVTSAPIAFGLAIGIQAALTLTQYGARQFAKRDRRWWIIYLAALGWSVYYNAVAYWTPLEALGLAWYVALAIILAGDIVPEIAAVRHT